jgi:hypothetical protein
MPRRRRRRRRRRGRERDWAFFFPNRNNQILNNFLELN